MHIRFLRRAVVAVALSSLLVAVPAIAHAAPASSIGLSAATAQVKAKSKPFKRSPRPVIVGDSAVGAVLRVNKGSWKPSPSFSYRWRVDGYSVAGATQSRYTVRAQDAGARITVVVRAAKRGYRSTERTSAPVQITVPSSPTPVVTPTPTPTPTPPPTQAPPAPQPPSTAPVAYPISGSGDYRVGVNVSPGVYVTTGATSSCYWERVRAFDGDFSSIIANDLGSGQRIITIKATDYGVSFSGCGSWTREADAPSTSRITTGEYLVGSQMPTGLYAATPAAAGCYWALLSDFDGSPDSIIANDLRSDAGTVYVQVGPGVRGFEDSDCGVWTKLQ